MAEVDVELEAIEHLDFRPVCQAKKCDGQTPADVVLVLMLPCCGARVPKFSCDPCKARTLAALSTPRDGWCGHCSRVTFGQIPADHIAILPIGGPR